MNNVFDHEKIKKRMRELEDFDADPKGEPIVMYQERFVGFVNRVYTEQQLKMHLFWNGRKGMQIPEVIIAKWKIYPK
jgi:hypothetical protein